MPRFAWPLALLVTLSGLTVRLPDPWAIAGARYALVHIVVGVVLGFVLPLLTQRWRRVVYAMVAVLFTTGLLLAFTEWVRFVRVWVIGLHAVAAAVLLAAFFPPKGGRRVFDLFWPVSVVVFVAGLLAAIPHRRPERPVNYAPFEPADGRTMTGGVLDFAVMNNSGTCAQCHPAIWREWRESMHSNADLADPLYMAAHTLLEEERGVPTSRYCSSCHNPGMMLSGLMLDPMPLKLPEPLRNEGVSCLACHAQQASDLRGNGSYILSHPQEAWFGLKGGLLRSAEILSIRVRPDWHAAVMRPANLGRPEFCAQCHTQTVDQRLNRFGFLKIRSEYEDWFGNYTGGHGTAGGSLACKDCHMPLIEGFDPTNRKGQHRSHRFIAGHSALPVMKGYPEQADLTRRFLRGEVVPSELQGRWPEGPLIAIQALAERYAGGATLTIGLTNVKVGHMFPAGTITFADCWVEVVVKDRNGVDVYRNGTLASDGTHDGRFQLYGTIVDEHGTPLRKAQSWKAVGMGERHTIAPGYTESYSYAIASTAPVPWTAEVRLHYRKITPRFLKFATEAFEVRQVPVVTMNEARVVF